MTDAPPSAHEPEASVAAPDRHAPSHKGRHWLAWSITIVVIVALLILVPRPVARHFHTRDARELVDQVAQGRKEVLRQRDDRRGPLTKLGEPVRTWTQVDCGLSKRFSDGDGEADVVMFYWQHCSMDAYELYSIPKDTGAKETAKLLGGHTASSPTTCAELLFDVLEPDVGAAGNDSYQPTAWWIDPGGKPPEWDRTRCHVPEPGDGSSSHVVQDVDRGVDPTGATERYVLYTVSSPNSSVDVGCEHRFPWVNGCSAKPKGFPVH